MRGKKSTELVRLYHGTSRDYRNRCSVGGRLPPTFERVPLEEDPSQYWEVSEPCIWLTNDPGYARAYGEIVLVVEVSAQYVETRFTPDEEGKGPREYLADTTHCTLLGEV